MKEIDLLLNKSEIIDDILKEKLDNKDFLGLMNDMERFKDKLYDNKEAFKLSIKMLEYESEGFIKIAKYENNKKKIKYIKKTIKKSKKKF